ncbi:MAG: hypothetical protein ACLFV3_11305 [Phycisphaeraceae bacterium]
MLILRIRQAETALAGGRLEEAFELLQARDLRSHHRGQQLADRLVEALVARGEAHLTAGRPAEAIRDADLARQVGGNQEAAAGLKARAGQVQQAAQWARQRQAELHRALRDQVQAGELSQGQHLLQKAREMDLSVTDEAVRLDRQQKKAAAALEQARAAMDAGELEQAVRALTGLQSARPGHPELPGQLSRLAAEITAAARDALRRGRIDRAEALLARSAPLLGDASCDLVELRGIVTRCRQAAECVETGDLDEAARLLGRLQALLEGAGWLGEALESVRRAQVARDAVREGPLGMLRLFEPPEEPAAPPRRAAPAAPLPRIARPAPGEAEGASSDRWLLQVDGGPSTLVLAKSVVRFGPVSSSQPPDVGLLTAADSPSVTIEAVEDGHLLRSETPVQIGGESVTRKLLEPGDEIQLGRRCRLRYHRPHAASGSATIDLTGARLSRPDVRRIVLLAGPLIVGRGRGVHVPVAGLGQPVVLFRQQGDFCARAGLGGPGQEPGQMVGIGEPARVGSLNMIIRAWTP